MHYYSFNIGDYSSHTSRLTPIEDIAYRRLLDLYYLNERPFNGCSTDVARDIGLSDHQVEVDYILSKYFHKDGQKWVNHRAEREIKAYQSKQQSASRAGKASAQARKIKASERALDSVGTDDEQNSDSVEPTNNQEPITNNHNSSKELVTLDLDANLPAKAKRKSKIFKIPTFEEVQFYCMERRNTINPQAFIDHYQAIEWMRGKNKIKDWRACIRTWERNQKNQPGGQNQLVDRLTDRSWSK